MNDDSYLIQLQQHHYHLKTEIFLLREHLQHKETSAATVLREIQILSTYPIPRTYTQSNTTAPHPLEDSPRSLELLYNCEVTRFQRRLKLLHINDITLDVIPFELGTIESSDQYNFHLDHYHFKLAHSRIPPDLHEFK